MTMLVAASSAKAPKPPHAGQSLGPIQNPRAGSKQALVLLMLNGKSGATLEGLIEATGWLPHTTRAALTGLRKKGFSIERVREKDASVYRTVPSKKGKGRDARLLVLPNNPFVEAVKAASLQS